MFYYSPYMVSTNDDVYSLIGTILNKERIQLSRLYLVGFDDNTTSIDAKYMNCIINNNKIPDNLFYIFTGKGFIRCDEKIVALKKDHEQSKGVRSVYDVAIVSKDYNDNITISGQEKYNDIEIEFIKNFNAILLQETISR